jgi:hypothetical protein
MSVPHSSVATALRLTVCRSVWRRVASAVPSGSGTVRGSARCCEPRGYACGLRRRRSCHTDARDAADSRSLGVIGLQYLDRSSRSFPRRPLLLA